MTTPRLGKIPDVQPAPYPPGTVSNWRDRIASAPWEIGLIVLVIFPSLVWIVRDFTPWPWDQAWYGEVTVDLWFSLTHSLHQWANAMLREMYMKPPGIIWLGQFFVPLGSWSGSIESAILLPVVLTQAVTLYLISRIGRSIAPGSKAVPALGICMAAATQSFVGLSHQFLVEPLQALTLAWVLLIAIRCKDWPGPRTLLQLVSALIFGVLAKATTPLYCVLPCLYIGLVLVRKRFWQGWKDEWRTTGGRVLAIFIGLSLPPTAYWYQINFRYVWQHIQEASSGNLALPYGFRASIAAKLIVWNRLLDFSFLAPYLGWVSLLAILGGAFAWFRPGGPRALTSSVRVTVVLSVLQAMLLLLVFSANDTVEARYMYAMLPLLLVVPMSFCASIKSRAVFFVLFALCAWQFVVVQRAALGSSAPLTKQLAWLTKPDQDRGRYNDIQRIVAATSTVSGRYNIVGVEEPWLSANTLSFFAAKHQLDTGTQSYFTSLGYAESDVSAAMKRVRSFKIMYYITLDEAFQTTPANFVNLVSLPVLKLVKGDAHFEQVGTTDPNGVVIFRSR